MLTNPPAPPMRPPEPRQDAASQPRPQVPSSDAPGSRGIAIFDLHGALTTRDSFLAFLLTFGRRHRRYASLMRTPPRLASYLARRIRDEQLKEALIRDYLAGCDAEQVAEHAGWFCDCWLPRFLHPIGFPLLEAHRARGDRLVLLSAGPSVFVPRIAAALGIAEVVCTTIATDAGRWTGTIVGGNCKGGRKLERLQAHLRVSHPPPQSFAYGDSRSDRFVLEWVEHGAWIRRRKMCPLQSTTRFPVRPKETA